jgi:hypothetical protein
VNERENGTDLLNIPKPKPPMPFIPPILILLPGIIRLLEVLVTVLPPIVLLVDLPGMILLDDLEVLVVEVLLVIDLEVVALAAPVQASKPWIDK